MCRSLIESVRHRASLTVTCCDLWCLWFNTAHYALCHSLCMYVHVLYICVYLRACCLNFSTASPSPGLLLMAPDLGWISQSGDTEVNGKCCLSTLQCGRVCVCMCCMSISVWARERMRKIKSFFFCLSHTVQYIWYNLCLIYMYIAPLQG